MLSSKKKALHIAILAGTLLIAGCGESDSETPANNGPESTIEYRHIGITANFDASTVTIFNADTMAVSHAAVALSGVEPTAITLSKDNKTAYVSNSGSDDISIIDLITGTEVGVIGLSGSSPGRSIIVPDGHLYVAFEASGFIAKVDIAATTPAEVDTFEPSTEGLFAPSAIVATPNGQSLYVAFKNEGDAVLAKFDIAPGDVAFKNESDAVLVKFDIASGDEVDSFPVDSINDLEIDSQGIIYIMPDDEVEALYRFDTNSDEFTDDAELSDASFEMNDLHLYDGKLFAVVNTDEGSGGVAEISTSFNPNGFANDSGLDVYYTVELPFEFNFQGSSYTEVTVNGNGAVSFDGEFAYDVDLDALTGFVPNNADLSSEGVFNYSSRLYGDRAVFQWLTSIEAEDGNVNGLTSFEVVLYDNGQARFDYLMSGPEAILQENGDLDNDYDLSYGVADGEDVLVNLRDALGSPFNLERKSYLWDPATPEIMTEVAFAWEGTGIHFHPAILSGEGGGGYTSGYLMTIFS